jgi:Tol biopolymer transport system component
MPRRSHIVLLPALLLAIAPSLGAQTVEQSDSAAAAAVKAKSLPLITTRTLEFNTDEGTWISLDLSPDGQTIVFELLGDLYTLPISGGAATRITSGQAYDMQPRFSEDGTKLVFVSDRNGSENLWVSDGAGQNARALTTGERESYMSPVWTRDGTYVLATKGTQLWLYHEDGGSGVQVTGHREEGGPPPPAHFGAAVGDDPSVVWVNLRGNLGGGLPSGRLEPESFGPDHAPRSSARLLGPYQIGQLDLESGRVLVRTHELEGAFRPVPSPDGRWLAYATRYDAREAIKLLDLESGEDQWLLMDVARDESQGGGTRDRDVYPGSAFMPDSRALITSHGGKIWRVEVPSGKATEIPFSADVEQHLGPLVKFEYPINDSSLTVSQIRGARTSPDGTQVVFSALDRLWIADLGDGDIQPGEEHPVIRDAERLTTSADVEHAPVWSPDGEYVAYVTWNDSTGGDVYRIPADGGSTERLTPTSAFFDKLSYSRDGSKLMAVRGSKMHRMRSKDGTPLTPDPTRIVYTSGLARRASSPCGTTGPISRLS